MAAVVTAIGNMLAGIGGGLSVNTTTVLALNPAYGGEIPLLVGLGTLLGPVFSSTAGIGPVLAALGGYLAAPGAIVTAILGIL